MEQIYRGYPQPYQIYNWENPFPEDGPEKAGRYDWNQWNYFRGLYPLEAKRLQRIAEEEFDRMDQAGGPMYDEYPDREFLYRVRDRMLAKALTEGAADRDLMQVVMLHELLRRRQERRIWK